MSHVPNTPRNTRAPSTVAPWQVELNRRSFTPTGPPNADAQDMLQLMRSTRGRMQGNVAFRNLRYSTGDWVTSYCYIDPDSAALYLEIPATSTFEASFQPLIADLRACRVCAVLDDSIRSSVIEIVYWTDDYVREVLQLRPERQTYFNSWYAALLCWQSCQPGQKISDDGLDADAPQHHNFLKPVVGDERARPLAKTDRTNATLRTERALLLTEGSPDFSNIEFPSDTTLTEVNCVLRGTGEFSIHALGDRRTLFNVQLRGLPRSAIQRLNKSVFGLPRTLAVYPQYARSLAACSSVRPVYLAFNYTDSFENLFILLRAFALPEVYPIQANASASPDVSRRRSFIPSGRQDGTQMFRIEHFLNARVNKAKLSSEPLQPELGRDGTSQRDYAPDSLETAEYYVELLVDEQIKAKTTVRASTKSGLFWTETFDLTDLPSVLSSLSFRLKKRHIRESGRAELSDTASIMTSKTGKYLRTVHSALDTIEGVAEVELSHLPLSRDEECTFSFLSASGSIVGDVSVKLRREEHVVLMEEEYEPLTSLLHTFGSGVTLDIFDRTPLRPADLANCLLNIFQASGSAETWLRHLIRDEIYHIHKHQRKTSNFSGNVNPQQNAASNLDNNDDAENSSRTNQALLLFRGNTLLTRALDSYMRRLGQAYLETTLRIKLQDIMDEEQDCEVDPSRLGPKSDHESNWQRLMTTTKEVWSFIRHSVFHCPSELRRIFRTIKDMATDRFGEVMPSKVYTSVSSFLFLRFFCAAIMNPKLFGLVKGDPGPFAQRTYMLVAKSLQGLANMSTFGNKEHWMAPMNTFCSANRTQFEAFINSICDVELDELEPLNTEASREVVNKSQGAHSDGSVGESITPTSPKQECQAHDQQTQAAPTNDQPSSTVPLKKSTDGYEGSDNTQTQPGTNANKDRIPGSEERGGAGMVPQIEPTFKSATNTSFSASRPSSPSDFNISESLAYTNSFATEVPLPESRSLTPEQTDQEEEFEVPLPTSRDSLKKFKSQAADFRASIASRETVIYVGPLENEMDEGSSHMPNKMSKNGQDRGRQKPRTASLVHQSQQPAKDDEAEKQQDEQLATEDHSDDGSVYESAMGSPRRPSSEGEMQLDSAIGDHNEKFQQPVPAVEAKESHKYRPEPEWRSAQNHQPPESIDGSRSSRSSTPLTVIARPSTEQSHSSLRSRLSLSLAPNDPLSLILANLPTHSREGLLSSPGLIDPAKNLALLVNIWLDSLEVRIHRAAAAAAAKNSEDGASIAPILKELDDPESNLAKLHGICQELKDRTLSYRQQTAQTQQEREVDSEDDGGITAGNIAVKWVVMVERMEVAPHEFWIARSDHRPASGDSSSPYSTTVSSDDYMRTTMSSRGSMDTAKSSSIYSAAPPPPNITRDRDRSGKSKPGRLSLFAAGGGSNTNQSARKGGKPSSLSSGGSDKTGKDSKGSSKSSRTKSPPRNAEDNAMRKLGWI